MGLRRGPISQWRTAVSEHVHYYYLGVVITDELMPCPPIRLGQGAGRAERDQLVQPVFLNVIVIVRCS